jgi:purine-binding chemotaxis protein CheW
MMSDERKICTFHVDDFYFGIDVHQIQEVIRYQEMTDVPLTNETIRGLINMRGQIVTAIDMRRRLNFSPLPIDRMPTNIIVYTYDDGAVSFLVDAIGDVIDIPVTMFENPPENLKGPVRQVLSEVCQLEKQLLLIMDIEQVLKIDE